MLASAGQLVLVCTPSALVVLLALSVAEPLSDLAGLFVVYMFVVQLVLESVLVGRRSELVYNHSVAVVCLSVLAGQRVVGNWVALMSALTNTLAAAGCQSVIAGLVVVYMIVVQPAPVVGLVYMQTVVVESQSVLAVRMSVG